MDVQLIGAALWRHKWLVGIGLVLAILVTAFSMVRWSDGKLVFRQHEGWESTSKILVTRAGFPEGSVASAADDDDRFVRLAYLYASFIDADSVRSRFEPKKIEGESVDANAIVVQDSGAALPIISVSGIAPTPARSIALTRKATNALLGYISQRQELADIATKNRVRVQLIQTPDEPLLVKPRSRTLPIMVLLACISLIVGFVFVLDNAQRSRRRVEELGSEESAPQVVGVATPPRRDPTETIETDAQPSVREVARRRAGSPRWQVKDDDADLPRAEPL
jgi:hypothetical protein